MIRPLVLPFIHTMSGPVSMRGAEDATVVSTGNASTALVGWTTDGSYPAGTTTNDVVIASISTTAFPSTPLGWTQIATGAIGAWGTYYAYQRTASGPLSGTVFSGNEGQIVMTLRGVSAANLVSAFSASSSWPSLSGLQNNAHVYAVGYTDTTGAHGGATLSASFTTQTNASRQVLATLTNRNSGTTFTYTSCSNNGTTAAMCFSYGIA